MNFRSLLRAALFALGAAPLLAACSSNNGSDEMIGQATLAVTSVPADVGCINVTVAGVRTVVRSLSVTPGQSSVFTLTGLPIGSDTFSGEGFAGACPPSAMAVAGWVSEPVSAVLSPGSVTDVTIKMVRNGRSNVGIDFQDDLSVCNDGVKNGSETDVDCGGGTCPACAVGRACASGTDCATSICVGGICSGCTTNAECPAGTICDPMLHQCTSACAPPLLMCAGACVDVANDLNICGICGRQCTAGQSCMNGTCTFACAPGSIICGGACVNQQVDSNNCGFCGHVCPTGTACSNSTCVGVPSSCVNGIRDGAESGVDCGGPTACPRCGAGQSCITASDCASTLCFFGICQP